MSVVHLDVETTGTNPDLHEVWEVAVVVEDDAAQVITEYHAFLRPERMDVADGAALLVGGFYDRFPTVDGGGQVTALAEAAEAVARLSAGRVVIGNNVHFDLGFLARLLRENDQAPAWHYHPVDVKALCGGLLGLRPPWTTEDLVEAMDIDIDKLGVDRHTARGDVEISRALYHMCFIDREPLLRTQLGLPALPDA